MSLSISIVVPVYNEIENIDTFVDRLVTACGTLAQPWEVILVDDGSHDGSTQRADQLAEKHDGVMRSVVLNRNYGQHAAIMCGFAHTRGDVVITIDADLQNPPEEIPRLVQCIEDGADVVGTIRRNRQDSLFRRMGSRGINWMVRKATGSPMSDFGCMLRAYRRPVVDAMLQCHERSTFIPVLANSFAKQLVEIKVAHAEREAGESKYSLWKLINLQFDLLTSMTTTPLRMLSWIGLGISAAGIAFGLLLLFLRLAMGAEWAGDGVFTLFAILFIFIGAQFIGLGLLGEYLGRVYNDVRGRPRYFVDHVAGTTHLEGDPARRTAAIAAAGREGRS